MTRAKEFHSIVFPYFQGLKLKVVDCCCGDGKVGFEFQSDFEVAYVDIYKSRRFMGTEVDCGGLEGFSFSCNSLILALHSCGELTDLVLQKAVESQSHVAVMPCCYNSRMRKYDLISPPDPRKMSYYSEKDYYDAFRVQYLRENGYDVRLEQIDKRITPMNNVIIGQLK